MLHSTAVRIIIVFIYLSILLLLHGRGVPLSGDRSTAVEDVVAAGVGTLHYNASRLYFMGPSQILQRSAGREDDGRVRLVCHTLSSY